MGKPVQFQGVEKFHDDDGIHFQPVRNCSLELLNRQPIYEENFMRLMMLIWP